MRRGDPEGDLGGAADFPLIQERGGVAESELYQVFNMGVGMVAMVAASRADEMIRFARARRHRAWIIGEVVKGRGKERVRVA